MTPPPCAAAPDTWSRATRDPKSPVSAIAVADAILAAARDHGAGAAWIDVLADAADCHRVTLERDRRVVASATLERGIGDAVIARLALLCDLDLTVRAPQTGRASVRDDGGLFGVIVTLRPSDGGLNAEVRLVDDAPPGEELGRGSVECRIVAIGDTIGSYRVVRYLGAGGMGTVFEVEHVALRKRFAMKVLRADVLDADPESGRRFVREARAAARVAARGIVDVVDFGALRDRRPYLVMELLDGPSLKDIVRDRSAVPPARAVDIVASVARALSAAHGVGVVHRDLTCGNVVVHREGEADERVVLLDFGAAHTREADLQAIPDGPPGMVVGTPHYMSPEQVRGLETDARTDLYALGVIFYELVTGEPPFDGDTTLEVVRKHVYDELPTPQSPIEALPSALTELIMRMLEKEPNKRCQSAEEVLDGVRRARQHMTRRGWRRWLWR